MTGYLLKNIETGGIGIHGGIWLLLKHKYHLSASEILNIFNMNFNRIQLWKQIIYKYLLFLISGFKVELSKH